MDRLDHCAVQGALKSLLRHQSSKASMLRHSAFFIVQLSHPYMTTGKTIALTSHTFVDKVMSLLLNMVSRLVITFLPRSKRLLISYITMCKMDRMLCCMTQEAQTWCSVTPWRSGMQWAVRRMLKRDGTYATLWLIHADAWQEPTQYYKAILL